MPQPRPYNNQGYLQNGGSSLPPGAAPLLPNQGRVIQTGPIRVLCIADVRGKHSSLAYTTQKGQETDLGLVTDRKPEITERTRKASSRRPYYSYW
jgi:hypothetical protein